MFFAASFLFDALLYGFGVSWRSRVPIVLISTALTGIASGLMFSGGLGSTEGIILLLSLARFFNALRVVEGRMQPDFLSRSTRRTALCFDAAQIAGLLVLTLGLSFRYDTLLVALSWLAVIVSGSLLLMVVRNSYKTRHIPQTEYYADKELPTVSILIPARNETRDLEDCLRSVLANDYPKLEIIVLDDCSHDKTSEIIRGFAHDGVRFIQGDIPDSGWLAKNMAYEKLATEASGELLLFCGVDVRLGSRSIRALVTTLLNRKKTMVSVLPLRINSTLASAFVQPMRYWWELALPRRLFNRPPVLSTCWLIRSKELVKLGGFAAVRRSVLPEAYFARELVRKNDSYSFVRSDDSLDVQTVKSFAAQRATAIRVRYPQLRKRPENVLALVLLEIIFLLGPFVMLGLHYANIVTVQVLPLALACLMLIASHVSIVSITNPANVPLALFNFPFVALTEIALALASMIKYEFSTVDWRGRNICIPVMHVTPKLPALKD